MRVLKGSVLILLLVMLLFVAAALHQLNEDNYLAHLITLHVENLSQSRQALAETVQKISGSAIQLQACEYNADTKSELDNFWKTHHTLCHILSSGVIVDYAFRQYQVATQDLSYRQYSLRATIGMIPTWLRVIILQESNTVVAWSDDF